MTRSHLQVDVFRNASGVREKTKTARNVLGAIGVICLFCGAATPPKELPDARDLVSRSLAAGEKNELLLRSYVSRTRTDAKQLAPDGSVKSEEVKTFDDVVVDGLHIRKLVEKDDKPLTGSDKQKEENRISKLIAQRKRENAESRDRRIAEAKEKREKNQRFGREILQAFDFKVTGEDTIRGRKTWVLDATPRPGYKPVDLKAQMFPHLHGTIWIDQQDLLWTKAEANAVETFSIGFSALAKFDKGAHLFFEQMRLDDGTWVNTQTGFDATARLAMMKHISLSWRSVSENYRKVPVESRIFDNKDEF